MPCKEAMVPGVVTITGDRTVAEAMTLLDKHNIRALPVVDKAGGFLGVFNIEDLLDRLLPAPLDFEENRGIDLRLDALMGSGPELAKHLADLMPLRVSQIMSDEDVGHVHQNTSLWEGIRQLVKHHGRPVPVLEENTRTLMGLISSQSITHRLLKLSGQRQES